MTWTILRVLLRCGTTDSHWARRDRVRRATQESRRRTRPWSTGQPPVPDRVRQAGRGAASQSFCNEGQTRPGELPRPRRAEGHGPAWKHFPHWEVCVQDLNTGDMVVGANGEGSPPERTISDNTALSKKVG